MNTITNQKILRQIHDALSGKKIETAEDVTNALELAGIALPSTQEPKPTVLPAEPQEEQEP